MSRSGSQSNCLDPLDALIDYSGGEYETMSYQSPSISPSNSSKAQFVRPSASATPTANTTMMPSSFQTMSGPSHQYDLYKQQTGIPAGALANTLAMNQNGMGNGYGYLTDMSPIEDFNDFNGMGSVAFANLDMELEYDSPTNKPAFFYPEQANSQEFINPRTIQDPQILAPTPVSSQTSNVGRLWPGMHQQQAALAKAQQQQRQQQELIQQQSRGSVSAPKPKSQQSTDPLVEEKISQLLNSMRQGSIANSEDDDATHGGMTHAQRMRKDEEDMDEDERLLASEEGKKLSSKERRQLRNKVSARAFRSRRKEYIGQLEGEIAVKVTENSDLRAQNKALMEENTRLSDLTRMLLSSPSFSGFLDNLSANPTSNVSGQLQQQKQQQAQQAQQSVPVERRQQPQPEQRVRKDANPYVLQQQQQQQQQQQHQQTQMHMAMIPEQPIDFSMLDLTADGFNYQPQVFSVLETPEIIIDASVLSGKISSDIVELPGRSYEKVDISFTARMSAKEATSTMMPDDLFASDPSLALFSTAPVTETTQEVDLTPIFGGVASEKALARYVLVDTTESHSSADKAMRRVERLCASLESATARLTALTIHY